MIGGDIQKVKCLVSKIRNMAAIASFPSEMQKEFDTLAESTQIPSFPGAVFSIPRQNQSTLYYGVCNNSSEWRRLRPLLLAFAGPTVTHFTGFPAPLINPTAIEAHLLKFGFHVVARLESGESPQLASRSLLRMVQLVSQAPVTTNAVPRSTSQLISLFFDALNGNDRVGATEIIELCRNELRLDALNLTFMNIQLLAHFEDWQSIHELPNFPSVCHTRKPPAVSSALLEALYQSKLSTCDAEKEVEIWLTEVRDKAWPLLHIPISATASPGTLRLYALEALHANPRRPEIESEVVTRRNVIKDLVVLLEKNGRVGIQRLVSPDFSAENAVLKTRLAVIEAEYSRDLSKIRHAQELFSQLEDSAQKELLHSESFRMSFQALQSEVGSNLAPRNLQEWFSSLSDPAFTTSLSVLDRVVSELPVEEIKDPFDINEIVELLNEVPDQSPAKERFVDCLPLLVSWVVKDPSFPRPSMSPIYESLLYHFVISSRNSRSTYDSTGVLIRALLSVGLTSQDYSRLLDDCLEILGAGIGLRNVYWILDVVEETIINPAPDPERRQIFWNEISARLLPIHTHLTPGQRSSIAKLASTLGWDEVSVNKLTSTTIDDHQVKTLREKLSGKLVSLYSLTESALRQAQSALEEIAPEAKVWVSYEKSGSSILKSYAQNSDIFVIATASAKHAATGFIQQFRPKDKITLFAAGRGFSSILRVLEEGVLK